MSIRSMLGTHPHANAVTFSEPLAQCVAECWACNEACIICADACLAEPNVEGLRQCISRNLDCADLCAATATIASRRTGANVEVLLAALEACALACSVCAQECAHHATIHEHCRLCADTCRSCEEACRSVMATVH
jgi:hypothetical protein